MLLTEFSKLPIGSLVSHLGNTGNIYMKIGADMYIYLGVVRGYTVESKVQLKFIPTDLFHNTHFNERSSFDGFVHKVEGFGVYDHDAFPTRVTEYEPCKPDVEQAIRATSLLCKLL